MAAASSHAFEGPSSIMRRLFGPTATAMSGGGGTMGSEEKMESTMLRDAEPTERGDAAAQVEPMATSATDSGEVRERSEREGASSGSGSGSGSGGGVLHKISETASSIGASVMSAVGVGGGGAMGMARGGGGGCPYMTSMFGQRLQDPTHSLKIHGHPVVSDTVTMEKLQSFTRAKIVERAVHACGSGALGYFVLKNDMSAYTRASLFCGSPGAKVPVAARFSTTTFGREYPDEGRNPRGLAFKFYTEQGNYDVLSINFPAFFCRDGSIGPDVIRSQQRNPANFQISFDSMLDFMSLVPESMLANLWFWSDHGTPQGWMTMDGYPCHTFKWVNKAGDSTYVKYKFRSKQGLANLTQAEAQRVSGIDPDFSKREMWQHIHNGGTAEWTLCVQLIPSGELSKCPVDPWDSTKIWPESQYPWQEVGDVVMDKNVDNYHRDTEQIAFSPGRLIDGIEPTPDPLLQWRLWLYQDAQIHRLGVNYHQIPVNSAWMADQFHPVTRDGAMRVDANGGQEPHYFPNSYPLPASRMSGGTQVAAPGTYRAVPEVETLWKPERISNGVMARSKNSEHETDPRADYVQAAEFYRHTLTNEGRANLHSNIAFALRTVSRKEVVVRWLLACWRTDSALALGVYRALESECARTKSTPPVDWATIEACHKQVEEKPLVDVNKGYLPVELSF